MLNHLESQTNPKVVAYFTESATIQLLLTALGAHKDNDGLRADNYQQMMRRKWRSSEVSPFASNLAVIKYGKRPSHIQLNNILTLSTSLQNARTIMNVIKLCSSWTKNRWTSTGVTSACAIFRKCGRCIHRLRSTIAWPHTVRIVHPAVFQHLHFYWLRLLDLQFDQLFDCSCSKW